MLHSDLDLDKKPISADESYVIPVKTNSSESEIYECVTHFMDLSREPENENALPSPMPWRFKLHIRDIDVTDSLIQHDIIYFQHTEKYPCGHPATASSRRRARTSSSRR